MDKIEEYYNNCTATFLIITCICIVYIITTLMYGPNMDVYQGIKAGGFNPVLVIYNHEYYRLISANFIHFGIMHLFCNAYSLFNLGSVMERLLDRKRYMIVFIVSMLSTTVLPYILFLFTGYGASSVMGGISGAIFGLIGSLLALAICYKDIFLELFKQISFSLILMLVISITVPGISLSGHVSGMIGGFVATMIIIKFFPHNIWKERFHNKDENIIN